MATAGLDKGQKIIEDSRECTHSKQCSDKSVTGMNLFQYSSDGLRAQMQLQKTHKDWESYSVNYPTAHPTRHVKNNSVMAEYYQPLNASGAPLVILFHGIGDQILIPCRLLARALVKRGLA